MTTRAGWTKDGKHFAETRGINGRTLYFIEGKITNPDKWFKAYKSAKAADDARKAKQVAKV